MSKISEFVMKGEAFRLTAWHGEEKGQNFYRVAFPGNDQWMTYEELLDLVERIRRDMRDMFYRWQDGRLDNDLVNQLEDEWRKPAETDADEADEA